MQETLDSVSDWTDQNLMRINEKKCNFMIFSRSEVATRLNMNNVVLDKVSEAKILGVWVTDDLSWSKNCRDISIRAFSRLSMLTKLRYVGTKIEDLVEIYILYIRSITEYCSVAYHSSLTVAQSDKLERIQKVCLRVILGDMLATRQL